LRLAWSLEPFPLKGPCSLSLFIRRKGGV